MFLDLDLVQFYYEIIMKCVVLVSKLLGPKCDSNPIVDTPLDNLNLNCKSSC